MHGRVYHTSYDFLSIRGFSRRVSFFLAILLSGCSNSPVASIKQLMGVWQEVKPLNTEI